MTNFEPRDHGELEHRLRQDLQDSGQRIPDSAVTSELVAETRRLGLAFRGNRIAALVLIVVAVTLVAIAILVSPALGRAEPTGNYRPDLPADTIALGCYPLPDGLTLDFPYQVRSDGDVDGRRVLTLHWDLLDPAVVRRRLEAALDRAGLPHDAATVTPFEHLTEAAIVRGTVVLELPTVPLSSDDPECRNPQTTKRFPADWAPSTEYG